ncbi:LacI family DNA-binding transcriptional regulator [Cellulosimicrobium arenosum]|uniref:LacI family DNA-binding transcriptional regulator n=1 Tax=Cellulosimicrobium arenosum TaxID=2708133 RepID=A0A927PCH1_9MICO|nr:LacI family DNA-binding transcriptional regulator [Cellulosimicrobium arenosum]MBD8079531.1 LacI family DNA-binding transcriptional regulator [Cellulosimicrobium arenosum]
MVQTTLADVAAAARVSRSTASRVLRESGYVSPDARRAVLDAVERLAYVPHPGARALASGRGERVVVAVGSPSSDLMADPYVARVVAAAGRAADAEGVGVALRWLGREPQRELERLARDPGVGGVLLVDYSADVLARVPRDLAARVAAIGPADGRVPSYDVDAAAGIGALVERVVARGRRGVVMLAGPPWLPGTGRAVDAYEAVIHDAGLPARVVVAGLTAADGAGAAREARLRWPDTDALVAMSDSSAIGALRALARDGVAVPDDVAVTGFDDLPLAGEVDPGLTTATHPVELITAAATADLLGQLRGQGRVFPSVVVSRSTA